MYCRCGHSCLEHAETYRTDFSQARLVQDGGCEACACERYEPVVSA